VNGEPKDGVEQARQLAASAQTEQAMAGVVTFTGLLGAYFKGLIKEGFLRDEALELAIEYQRALLSGLHEGTE